MSLRIRFRFDGRCSVHPRYNPERDGRPQHKDCSGCESLWASFEPALTKAEEADPVDVWRCVECIPPEWYEYDHGGLERIVEAIYQRRTMIRNLIGSFRMSSRDPFPNWTQN